ncbi:baculoviral IAP repeat-containing protein [Acrasis kona]|uniref:Baculoviral IAP repeat-containing protein n=1 Tax=Acrasis kona TaxID=1008807 RepID=A0AAW2ZJH9_9EUKA
MRASTLPIERINSPMSQPRELDIFTACRLGNLNEVRRLIRRNPDLVSEIDFAGCNPIYYASKYGHADVIKYLGNHGAIDPYKIARRVAPNKEIRRVIKQHVRKNSRRRTDINFQLPQESLPAPHLLVEQNHPIRSGRSLSARSPCNHRQDLPQRSLTPQPPRCDQNVQIQRPRNIPMQLQVPPPLPHQNIPSIQILPAVDQIATAPLAPPISNKQPESNDVSEDVECVVCMENNKSHLCVPCGHYALCKECAPIIISSKMCPICRSEVTNCIQVFHV